MKLCVFCILCGKTYIIMCLLMENFTIAIALMDALAASAALSFAMAFTGMRLFHH